MTKRTGDISELRAGYERAANSYLEAFNKAYNLDPDNGYWVGDDVGGVYCNGDIFFVSFSDMIFIVDNAVPQDEYLEWIDYCTWAHEFGQPEPNLMSWHAGCPRHGEKTMRHLSELKKELMTNIEILTTKTIKEQWKSRM